MFPLSRYLFRIIMIPVITLQLFVMSVGLAGLTQASIIVDMQHHSMLRDNSHNNKNNNAATESPAATTTSSSSSLLYLDDEKHRQKTENILRNNYEKNDGHHTSGDKDKTKTLYKYNDNDDDSTAPSGELLHFVNDNDSNDIDDDSFDMSLNDEDNGLNGLSPMELSARHTVMTFDKDSNSNSNSNSDIDSDSYSDSSNGNGNSNTDYLQSLALKDQVRLLSKQLNVLMNRRREDYELLERNLRKSLRIPTSTTKAQQAKSSSDKKLQEQKQLQQSYDVDLRNEVESLKQEIQDIKKGHLIGNIDFGLGNSNKERLTIEWLQQSIGELRKQLVELQQIASNAMRDVTTRTQSWEDLTTIRSDFQQLKLELASLKERQQQTDVYVQELREETQQQEEEYKRLAMATMQSRHHQQQQQQQIQKSHKKEDNLDVEASTTEENKQNVESVSDMDEVTIIPQTELLADHKRRHLRFQRQQLHELQLSQRQLRRQFNELKYHRIGERVRSIEIEQHRIADANFNLSRQIASLDKLHSSMLELLEDVENVQTKVDKNIPELRHEISKLEFSHAQLMSEQNLVREEGKNVARSLQAMAVSVSTLQDERDGVRRMQSNVGEMRTQMDRLQSIVGDVQRALQHRQHRGGSSASRGNKDNKKFNHHHNSSDTNSSTPPPHSSSPSDAESLVAKLENVEQQFESIIAKLPRDCSEVTPSTDADTPITNDGLYLIAPAGDRHPLMAHCTRDGWTTVQRRYDGSADFNRSWEDYANGFGSPAGEFWIGNEQLHHLTLNNCTQLRVLMQDIYDNVWLAEYGQFYISSRSDGYRLHISDYSGNASDALDYQQGMQFSAIDVDRDISQTHCAANYEGGWWFSHCQHANLNGRYNLGLTWFDAQRNEWIAVKSSQMMIKRQTHETCNYNQNLTVLDKEASAGTNASPTMTTTTTTSASASTTATTTLTTTTGTINSNKSIPFNNLRLSAV